MGEGHKVRLLQWLWRWSLGCPPLFRLHWARQIGHLNHVLSFADLADQSPPDMLAGTNGHTRCWRRLTRQPPGANLPRSHGEPSFVDALSVPAGSAVGHRLSFPGTFKAGRGRHRRTVELEPALGCGNGS